MDHKAEAEALVGVGWRDDWAQMGLAEAQVHATLYLAEQQRIANIIAWTTSDGYRPSPHVQDEITKGLGL